MEGEWWRRRRRRAQLHQKSVHLRPCRDAAAAAVIVKARATPARRGIESKSAAAAAAATAVSAHPGGRSRGRGKHKEGGGEGGGVDGAAVAVRRLSIMINVWVGKDVYINISNYVDSKHCGWRPKLKPHKPEERSCGVDRERPRDRALTSE